MIIYIFVDLVQVACFDTKKQYIFLITENK